jgi:hypothetical protein
MGLGREAHHFNARFTTMLTLIAQTTPPEPSPWIHVAGAVLSSGFAVWYAWYTTTKTIPDMQKEHREERKELVDTCKQLTTDFRSELSAERLHREKEAKENREQFRCPVIEQRG